MSRSWPRAPLSQADLDALYAGRWKVFPRDTVVEIAEAWNAGFSTAEMAADLGCRPASLRMLLGALTQRGVKLRSARDPGKPDPCAPRQRSPLAEQMAEESLARLRRVATWDPAARRALDLYERGGRA